MVEKTFYLDQENYFSQYKSAYGDLNFKSVIQFAIVLPFQVQIPDGSIISFKEQNSVLRYHFLHFEQEKGVTLTDNLRIF